MYYIINPDIGIRSWWRAPYAYYRKGTRNAMELKEDEFEFLYKCDGVTPLEESELSRNLLERGFISQCGKG